MSICLSYLEKKLRKKIFANRHKLLQKLIFFKIMLNSLYPEFLITQSELPPRVFNIPK